MLNRVQHDGVGASPWTPKKCVTLNTTSTSPWITPLRHPELVSGSRLWDAESSSAWRGRSGASLVFSAPKQSLFFLFFHDSHKFESSEPRDCFVATLLAETEKGGKQSRFPLKKRDSSPLCGSEWRARGVSFASCAEQSLFLKVPHRGLSTGG